VIALGRPQTPRLMRLPQNLSGRALFASADSGGTAPSPGDGSRLPALTDRALEEWCLQFFEAGAAHWRQRLGR
jgi:hypothetical protein